MKKLISKMIPLALLVLALCMVSVAASAATVAATPESAYNKYNADGTVTVDATLTGATEGESMQMVVLAVKADEADSTDDLTTLQAADALASAIVYVDQATVTSGTAKSFTFKPKDNYAEDINVFVSGTDATPVMLSIVAPVTNYTVTFEGATVTAETSYAAGTSLATIAAAAVPAEKAGYTFVKWVKSDDSDIAAGDTLSANTTLKAVWDAHFQILGKDGGYITDGETQYGLVSVTAKLLKSVTNVTKYGFYIYNPASAAVQGTVELDVNTAAFDADGFYTVAYGIPAGAENAHNTTVIIKPFVIADGATITGEATEYTASEFADITGALKNLGTYAEWEAYASAK